MERLEQDLRYFKLELSREQDPFRRNLLLVQIRDTEQRILNLMREESARLARENRNMEEALAMIAKFEGRKKQ